MLELASTARSAIKPLNAASLLVSIDANRAAVFEVKPRTGVVPESSSSYSVSR